MQQAPHGIFSFWRYTVKSKSDQLYITYFIITWILITVSVKFFWRGKSHFSSSLVAFGFVNSLCDRLILRCRGYCQVLTPNLAESYTTVCWTILRIVSNVPSDLVANHLVLNKRRDITGWLSAAWINSITCCHLQPHTRGFIIQ